MYFVSVCQIVNVFYVFQFAGNFGYATARSGTRSSRSRSIGMGNAKTNAIHDSRFSQAGPKQYIKSIRKYHLGETHTFT